MSSLKKILDKTITEANNINTLERDALKNTLSQYGFAIVRGIVNPQEIIEAKQALKNAFSAENDNPTTGETPEQLKDNYQKFVINGFSSRENSDPNAKCMRTFYNPIWAEDIYRMRDVFRRLAMVRNIIYGFDTNFAVDDVEDGLWTAARIHHYPAGGGFISTHIDNYIAPIPAKDGMLEYYQPILTMSKKGSKPDCDFETGGGFFEVDGIRYFYEEETELGDMVIYNSKVPHGVVDIDNAKRFQQNALAGRFAAFATLYKQL